MNCKLREIALVFFRVLWRATRKTEKIFNRLVKGGTEMNARCHSHVYKVIVGGNQQQEYLGALLNPHLSNFYLFTSKLTSRILYIDDENDLLLRAYLRLQLQRKVS